MFNRKPPTISFSYNHPKSKVRLKDIYYMTEMRMLHLRQTLAGSALGPQLCFPCLWNALGPNLKLWCQMRQSDLAPEEHENHERSQEQPLQPIPQHTYDLGWTDVIHTNPNRPGRTNVRYFS